MGALRSQWLAAPSPAEQQRISRDIQVLSFEEIPYFRLTRVGVGEDEVEELRGAGLAEQA
jgi:hypothetical protein